ncbi:VIP peptides-like [Pelmatolapia mariae]|uniref:VIP peptides-like n=1 Tax=Pelmatolapia mariae TaxID=158779 RepID=UPI002FE5FEFD
MRLAMTRSVMCLQLLFLCALMCAALPPPAFYTRSSRHADGLFTSGYSRLLSQLTAKDYLESLMEKRVNGDLTENLLPAKRHSDAVFTDSYSRFRKQMAAKKYLNSVLQGKRSVDDVTLIAPDISSSLTNEGSLFHDIISQLTLDL